MTVEINEVAKLKLKNPVVIEGFPGIGMIGTIGASYLADQLKMTLVGCLSSNEFPPVAAIHNYVPMSPARIYASKEHDLIVLFSEFIIPANIVFELSKTITSYARQNNARAIYSLAGIASPKPGGKIFGVSSTAEMAEFLKSKGVELVKEGATQGVSGVLIAKCASEKVPAANLMVQTSAPLDPAGSARLLGKLSEITGIPMDTAALSKEAKKIEEKMKVALEKMKNMHKGYEEFADNPMYA